MELPPSLVDGEVCWKRPADLYEVGVATTSCRTSYVGGGDHGVWMWSCCLGYVLVYHMFAVICPQTAGMYKDQYSTPAGFMSVLLMQTPLIIEKPDCSEIDLVSANGHLMHSEVCMLRENYALQILEAYQPFLSSPSSPSFLPS